MVSLFVGDIRWQIAADRLEIAQWHIQMLHGQLGIRHCVILRRPIQLLCERVSLVPDVLEAGGGAIVGKQQRQQCLHALLLNFIHRKVAHTIYSTQYKKVKTNKQSRIHTHMHTPTQTYKHVAIV